MGVKRDRRLIGFARTNRKTMNDAEVRLWFELRRGGVGGVRFRRQHPVGRYILDFAAPRARVCVEVDGSQHAGSIRDRNRDAYLRARGWSVVRVWSWDVLRDIEGVLDDIANALE